MYDKNGRCKEIIGVVTDFTHYKEFEDKLLLSEQKMKGFFKYTPLGIALFSTYGALSECNPMFRSIFGKQIESINLFDLEFIPKQFRDKIVNGEIVHFDQRFDESYKNYIVNDAMLDGSLYLSFWISTYGGTTLHRGIIVTFWDITKRKLLEQQKESFVNTISHELRTPLAAIKASICMLNNSEIIIEKTEHGNILKNMFESKKIKCIFVYGDTSKEKRDSVKNKIQDKKIKVVICSRIWKEGINIPSLNNVINAFGMSGEIATLQTIGRGLRIYKNKKTICLVDFLDPYQYLAQHAILRIQTYQKQGWI